MIEHILYLFPDTNVFIQCKPLNHLDWSDWKEFSEVHLLVSRPVQREIDNQKSRGNDRVANKARTTYTLFRKIIDSTQKYELVNSSSPTVKLFLQPPSRPSPELQDMLDYDKPDDEIVGCLHRFLKENPGVDARLLTYDSGPIMTSGALGLPYVAVKEGWLVPSENNETERENARLKERIAQLERTEPQFKIGLVDENGKTVEQLKVEHLIYEPLSESDIETLRDSLTNRFPMRTNFSPSESAEDDKGITVGEWLDRKFASSLPKDEDITKYRDQDYPRWVRECRKILSGVHSEFQRETGQPTFGIVVTNEGTRPGNDALVVIEATVNFKICPPPYKGDLDEDPKGELALPRPPRPPKGPQIPNALNAFSGVNRIVESMNLLQRTMNPVNTETFRLPPSQMSLDQRRDPNGFFYKPNRPSEPGESFAIECDQWRHGMGPEPFVGEIFFEANQNEIRGVLRCEVHAENLSSPVMARFPVRITVRKVTSYERARDLVQKLRGPII